ncbi:MAG: hypothetical protein WEA82_00035 [Idiomarina sp.]
MRVIVFLLVMMPFSTMAQDCLSESEAFFGLVAAKWAVNEGIEKHPEKFDNEKWLYIWAGNGSVFKKKNISEGKGKSMARMVAKNDFSESPEVEVNIFEDYWYLSCEINKKGDRVIPLEEIAKDSLLDCWSAASSRSEFQSCLLPLVKLS